MRPRKTGLRVERSPLHPEAGPGDVAGCGDARRRLGRQGQAELIEENPFVGIGLGVAAEDQRAPVGGREVDVEHLDGGKLVERGSRGEPCGERAESGAQRDVQTIGQEGDDAMRFDPLLQLVVDRSQSEIVLEGFERRLDLDQLNVELPQLGGVFPR